MISHPHAIRVDAQDGNLTLRGPILQHEVHDLLRAVGRVAGVKHVDCQLEVHKQAGDIAALQGGRQRPGDRFELMQENWAPATRLVMGSLGAGIGFYGFARRDIWGAFIGLFGASLLVRSASNLETRRLIGAGAGRRGVDIQKTININASPQDVFDFWRNYDNFPLFMHNVREVKDLGNGRSRWRIAGPAGTPVEFNSVITAYIPNELIAWKSEEGSIIRSAGIVRFDRNTDGSTRVNIQMTYNPVAGAVGHAVAALFGADPKSEMDADLARLKTLIETGNFPHDAAKSPAEMM